MTDYLELLGLRGPSKLEQKQASVETASKVKQAQIDPAAVHAQDYIELDDVGYGAKYGAKAMLRRGFEQAQRKEKEDLSTINRGLGEHIQDGVLNATRMAQSFVTGAAGLTAHVVDKLLPDEFQDAGAITQALIDPAQAQLLAHDPGLAFRKQQSITSKVGDKLLEAGADIDQILRGHLSAVDQANQDLGDQDNALDSARHRHEANQAIAEGTAPIVAKGTEILKNLGSAAANTAKRPTLVVDAATSQLPMFAMGPAARALTTADGVAARAALMTERAAAESLAAGGTGAAVRTNLARDMLLQEARQHVQERNMVGLITATESLGNYQQTAAQILETPIEELVKHNPEARARIEAGEDPELVRSDVAQKAAVISATVTAPIAAVSSKLAAKFELSPTTGGLGAEASLARRAAEAPLNMVKEGLEETLQGGGGALAGNIGERAAGNVDVDLTTGVGEGAGQGLVAGVGSAGAFQVPGLTGKAAAVAGNTVLSAGKAGIDNFLAFGDARRQAALAPAKAQEQAHQLQTQEQGATVSAALKSNPITAESAHLAPVAADAALSPEVQSWLGVHDDASLDRASTLGKVLVALHNNPDDLTPAQQGELQGFALRTKRELEATRSQLLAAADTETTPELKQAHVELATQIHALVDNDFMRGIEAKVAGIDEEQVNAILAALPETAPVAGVEAPPAVAQAIAQLREVSYVAPEKISAEGAKRAMAQQGLSDEDLKQLELVYNYARIRENHVAQEQALGKEHGSTKTSDIVTQEINTDGHVVNGKKLLSVNDHVAAISQAMSTGKVQVAKLALADLAKFAQHMATKAAAFDAVATQQVTEGSPKQDYPVNYKPTGLDNGKAFVNIHQAGSRQLIDTIHLDANTVVDAYNLMAQSFPAAVAASQQDESPLPTTITVAKEPSWSRAVPTPKVPDVRAESVPAVADTAGNGAQAAPAAEPVADKEAAPREVAPAPVAAAPVAETQPEEAAPARPVAAEPEPEAEPAPVTPESEADVAAPRTLDDALNMGEDAYIQAINPGNKVTEDADAMDALGALELPKSAKFVETTNNLELHEDTDGTLYAVKDDEVLGYIGPESGGTLNYVIPKARDGKMGVRIGTLLVKRYMTLHPFAQSGGFSKGGEQARRRAYRELLTERRQAFAPVTMAQRFSNLRESLATPENATAEQKLKATNRFLAGFQLVKNSQALFARMKSPLDTIAAAVQKALQRSDELVAVPELFADQHAFLQLSKPQLEALNTITTQLAPELVQKLNEFLLRAALGQTPEGKQIYNTQTKAPSKGFLDTLLNHDEKAAWQYESWQSLHAALWGRNEDGKPFLAYDPEIAQAMALAGIQWAIRQAATPVNIDLEDVLADHPEGLSPELRAAYETMPFFKAPVQDLTRDITDILGVRMDTAAPANWADGVAKALALDTLHALQSMGVLEVVNITGSQIARPAVAATATSKAKPAIYKSLSFLNFNVENNPLQAVGEQLGSGTVLSYLLQPESERTPVFGKPSTKVSPRVQGTDLVLSPGQSEAVANSQKIPVWRNGRLLQVLDLLGGDNMFDLLNYNLADPTQMAPAHARSVAGMNNGIARAVKKFDELDTVWLQYAANRGVSVDEIPLFNHWHVVSNGRMMNSDHFNDQANKFGREVLSKQRAVLNLRDDAAHRDEFLLALAQAFGLKTTKEPLAEIQKKIRGILESDEPASVPYQQVTAKLRALMQMTRDQDGRAELADDVTRMIRDLRKGTAVVLREGVPVVQDTHLLPEHERALNALVHWAAYQEAKANGSDHEFTNYLAYEVDGTTDGPINALMHMGLGDLNDKIVTQLRQGGVILNELTQTSLNLLGNIGDMYQSAADQLQTYLQEQLATREGVHRKALVAVIHLLTDIDYLAVPDSSNLTSLEAKRNSAKDAVLTKGYGAGDKAVVAKIAYAVVNNIYAQMSAAIVNDAPLPQYIQSAVSLLMGSLQDKDGNWRKITPPNLSNVAAYTKLEFTAEQIQALQDNLMPNGGKALTAAVNEDMRPVRETMAWIYKASALQTLALRQAYTKAAAARKTELVAEGKMLATDQLSRDEETQLLESLQHLAPTYPLLHSTPGALNQGISTLESNRAGESDRKVQSISGGLKLALSMREFLMPGVRAGALLVIGAGDSTMMTTFNNLRVQAYGNVWDGAEFAPGSLAANGKAMNDATVQGWKYDLLGGVAESYSRLQLNVKELSDAEVTEALDALQVSHEDMSPDEQRYQLLVTMRETSMELNERAAKTLAAKQVLFGGKFPVATDHMAGVQQPWTNGVDRAYQGNLVQFIRTEMDKLLPSLRAQVDARAPVVAVQEDLGGKAPVKPKLEAHLVPQGPVTESAELSQRLKLDEGMASLDAVETMLLLGNFPFVSKLQKFIAEQIVSLLPDNLQVHVGTAEQIAAKQAQLAAENPEEFAGVNWGDQNTVGLYYRGHVFVKGAHIETLLHELVHAATLHLVEHFYAKGGKGMSPHQKDAVRSLEKLTREFLTMDPVKFDQATAKAMLAAQQQIQRDFTDGFIANGVNEFMAWALTNRRVASALQQTPRLQALKAIAVRVRNLVRKALGLPQNVAVESFLDQALANFHRLVRRPVADVTPSYAVAQQLLSSTNGTTGHDAHVEHVVTQMRRILDLIPRRDLMPDRVVHVNNARQHALRMAEQLKEAFLNAHFDLNPREQHAFELLQAVFGSAIALNPNLTIAMQHVYDAVVPQLVIEDFLSVPNSTDPVELALAQNRLTTLTNTPATDGEGRSTHLANFVALAAVYPALRARMAQMELANPKLELSNLDGILRSVSNTVIDKLADLSASGRGNSTQLDVLDKLIDQLALAHEDAVAVSDRPANFLDLVDEKAGTVLADLGDQAISLRQSRQAAGKTGTVDRVLNAALDGAGALLNTERGQAQAEVIVSEVNKSKLPSFIKKLINEVIGTTNDTHSLHTLLNQSKSLVAQVRQRLRDQGPEYIQAFFEKPLDTETSAALFHAIGRTDLQAVLQSHTPAQLLSMLDNPLQMQNALNSLLAQLPRDRRNAYANDARALAAFMVHRTNDSTFLRRNAKAIARQVGNRRGQVSQAGAEAVEPVIDQLVTLYALDNLGAHEKTVLANLLRTQPGAINKLQRLMRTLHEAELAKDGADANVLNAWKGAIPQTFDPRADLVLAGPQKGRELLNRGYRLLRPYDGDQFDPQPGLAYYATKLTGGRSTYNQGAIQTVEGTVGGVDRITGRTLDPAVKAVIGDRSTVADITHMKHVSGNTQGSNNLLPIFNKKGDIIAYERLLDAELVQGHLRGKTDLVASLAVWMGRQAEEELAEGFNQLVVAEMVKSWQEAQASGRTGEFVNVSSTTASKVMRDTWETVPKKTQLALRQAFGGAVMVRQDKQDNTLGYRNPSVADLFTGTTDLPNEIREVLEKTAYALMGPHAFKVLTIAERSWQGIIGSAKDWIIVRSGVVGYANIMANQLQILGMGVPWKTLGTVQARKVKEMHELMKNSRRIAQLTIEKASTNSPTVLRDLEREEQLIRDTNQRLSIWPLVAAGELQAITEGLSEQDDYTLLADATRWVQDKVDALPPALSTAAKYAVIAKDTALYQGLNRMIQFGDFIAKATVYDHLIQQKKTHEEALREISETFVNYNLLPGRGREYLEKMGVTWFMNYKLRIQKIVLRNLRTHPIRFLAVAGVAALTGTGSLLASSLPMANWSYGLGFDPLASSHKMLLWNKLWH